MVTYRLSTTCVHANLCCCLPNLWKGHLQLRCSGGTPTFPEHSQILLLSSYPDVTFIWKYEDPENAEFAKGIENLFLSKWTPQNDLLADERLTLFITHGGAGSIMEGAMRGKPLIVIPLFGDQSRNAKLVVKFGFGLQVDKSRLHDSNVLREAIRKVLEEPEYTRAAHRIRDLLTKRPFTPQEKLVKTVELAAEFGHLPELYVTGRDLDFIAYHNIDLFVLLLATCSFLIFFVFLCLKKLLRLISGNNKLKVQ
ncbi:glycosyltransferase family 28 protein [Oesophagostomum dentatum]|uniref:UDP-glucuronosyltransferase n=1 Tax=Oesophagostomum dentatum TaxID=61180 RepID=A0A0B1SIF6_OESDE|nr:glycosyltransferase family 28 protein [Oesophagostomum dentatum]